MLIDLKVDPYAYCFSSVLRLVDFSEASVFAALTKWLWECRSHHEEHKNCPVGVDSVLPKRVLDLGERKTDRIKLHLSEPLQHGRYVALSYCWGGPQQLLTTTDTMNSHLEGISFKLFPKTIKDAIIVARKLGIRYLWVDALCIIQDDDLDKQKEIDSMGELYKNSTVTISAAKAKRVTDGFLDLIVPWNICRLPFTLEDRYYGSMWLTEKASREAKASEPLLTRGWAFQELHLPLKSRSSLPYMYNPVL